ncbi:F0F1 ATP synthase subunit B [Candidatus Poribacteria bacterium]|nr:F0F1 ATP synthase subunit B [Candidatus Poribacteria bacterium]
MLRLTGAIRRYALGAMTVAMTAMAWVSFAEEAAHGAEGGGGVAAQLHLDPKIILAQVVGFLVMFVILWFAVFRRVGGLLDKRRDDIAARLRKLEEDQAELDRRNAEAQRRLIDAEREAMQRLNATVEEAARIRDDILAKAHAGAEAELERARETIERETAAAVRQIRTEVADLAIQAASTILSEDLNDDRHRRLVNDFIERIPERAVEAR